MKNIKLIAFDVDGVLTNGHLFYSEDNNEAKVFHSRDGLGIKLLVKNGFIVSFITARKSKIVEKRAQELGIQELHQGVESKIDILKAILLKYNLNFNNVAYAGDDLVDLACMKKVALAMAPSEAAAEVLAVAHFISNKEAGNGAARQMAEFILKKQNLWNDIVVSFL